MSVCLSVSVRQTDKQTKFIVLPRIFWLCLFEAIKLLGKVDHPDAKT